MKARTWLFLSLLAATVTGLYMHRVLLPWEYRVNVGSGRVIAQLSDLFPRWVGTRDLLLFGRNPYGPDVSHEIQQAYYGHFVSQTYDGPKETILDEQRFAYPVYVVFLLAPTVWSAFADVQTSTVIILAILTALSVPLWLDFLRWRPPGAVVAAMILFTLSSPQVVQGLRLCQLGLLVGFLITVAAWCVRRNRLATAGAMLAISTIKPQMTILLLAWFLLWAAADLTKRWRLLAGFAGTLALLVGAGELLLPGWPRYFVAGLSAYRKYVPLSSLVEAALGTGPGRVLAGIVIAGIFAFAWQHRKLEADSKQFTWVLAAVCMVTTVTMPIVPPFNQVLLLPVIFMLLRDWRSLRPFARLTFTALIGWPWLTAAVLLPLLPAQPNPLNHIPLVPSVLTLFVPLLLPLLLIDRVKVQAC